MAPALPFISLGFTGFGTGMSVIGQIGAGMAARAAGKEQLELAREQARAELKRADSEEKLARQRMDELFGTQRTQYAKAGVRMEGSPLLVMAQSMVDAEKDIRLMRKDAENRAKTFLHGGLITQQAGNAAATERFFGAGSSLLSGISGGISTYSGFTKK